MTIEEQGGSFVSADILLLEYVLIIPRQETGWESEKPGYDGLIEVANHLTIGRSNSETIQASVHANSI